MHSSLWWEELWAKTKRPRVLQVVVGSGKNLAHDPGDVEVTAIDFIPKMLDRARRWIQRGDVRVDLDWSEE